MAGPGELAGHLLTLATLRLLTLSPDGRFTHVRAVPLHVLGQLTARYLDLLAVTARAYAALGGRTEPNSQDVLDAIAQFGTRIDELRGWAEERRLGGEGVQMAASGPVDPATLGSLLGVHEGALNDRGDQIKYLEYGPITHDEASALAALQSQAGDLVGESVPDRSDSPLQDSPATSPEPLPPSYAEAVQETLVSSWYANRPADPLSFLPAIPDISAAHDVVQTVIEDESGRTVKRARRTLNATATSSWQRAVPFDASQLAEFETRALPDLPSGESRPGGLVEDQSSLPFFLETFNFVSLDLSTAGTENLPLRQSSKRRRAATAIHSNILNPSDDSLSGAIPVQPPRLAKKQAGWIPYPPLTEHPDPTEPSGKAVQAFPPLHPFTTLLPPTVAESVPSVVLPHPTRLLAPSMHPRNPTAHASIRTLLESTQPHLFSRSTRLGPPGPLLDNGAAGYYEVEVEKPTVPGWIGETAPRMMSWSFDWEFGEYDSDRLPLATPSTRTPTAHTSAGHVNGDVASPASYPAFPQIPQRQTVPGRPPLVNGDQHDL